NYTAAFKTTSLCFAEALGVLKSKYVNRRRTDHIDEDTYLTAADELRAYVKNDPIELVDVGINDSAVFSEVEEIARRYSLDVSDVYKIIKIKNAHFKISPKAHQTLIPADTGLAKAARAEKLRVWDCITKKAP